MNSDRVTGIISPILTPFNTDGEVATDLFIAHAQRSLAQGAHYIAPFGTTGEAASVGIQERVGLLRMLADAGVDPRMMMPGTGLNALSDTVSLTRAALGIGCAAVMVLPPHFYPASDEALYVYYCRLVEQVASDALRICLYHIPKVTGVPISPALAQRLSVAFPGVVTAYKDSGGDWEHTRAVIEAAPALSVFPASEIALVDGLGQGAAGCISATCNTQIARIRAYWNARVAGDDNAAAAMVEPMSAHRLAVQNAGFIPALKSMMADKTGNRIWRNLRPPCDPAPETLGSELNETLDWTI